MKKRKDYEEEADDYDNGDEEKERPMFKNERRRK
jgi:hypothetical protein